MQYRPLLLVEDNPFDVDLTLRAFRRRAIPNPLQIARDGAEALEYLERWERGEPFPAAVLLDIQLPCLSGLQVLQRIKSHPHYYFIPVIMLTCSAENKDIQTAYQLGANSYLVKPAHFEQFLEMLVSLTNYWNLLNHQPNKPHFIEIRR